MAFWYLWNSRRGRVRRSVGKVEGDSEGSILRRQCLASSHWRRMQTRGVQRNSHTLYHQLLCINLSISVIGLGRFFFASWLRVFNGGKPGFGIAFWDRTILPSGHYRQCGWAWRKLGELALLLDPYATATMLDTQWHELGKQFAVALIDPVRKVEDLKYLIEQ